MTSEPVVGVDLGRQVVCKMTLISIRLPFHSPTQASHLSSPELRPTTGSDVITP